MVKKKYKVALIGVEDEQIPTAGRRRRIPGTVAMRAWWSWSWQLRIASITVLVTIGILVLHFGG